MNRQQCRLFLFSIFLMASAAPMPARADVKFTQLMTIDSPQIHQAEAAHPDQRDLIDKATKVTLTQFISGKKQRIDMAEFMGMVSFIVDPVDDQTITINGAAHTYTLGKFDPVTTSQTLLAPGMNHLAAGQKLDFKVTDTGNTPVVMGHKCHEYILTTTVSSENAGVTNMKVDLIAAQDFGAADTGFNPFAEAAGNTKVTGIPLSMTISLTGGKLDGTTMKESLTSISTDSIPASTFGIPPGYLETLPQAPTTGV